MNLAAMFAELSEDYKGAKDGLWNGKFYKGIDLWKDLCYNTFHNGSASLCVPRKMRKGGLNGDGRWNRAGKTAAAFPVSCF